MEDLEIVVSRLMKLTVEEILKEAARRKEAIVRNWLLRGGFAYALRRKLSPSPGAGRGNRGCYLEPLARILASACGQRARGPIPIRTLADDERAFRRSAVKPDGSISIPSNPKAREDYLRQRRSKKVRPASAPSVRNVAEDEEPETPMKTEERVSFPMPVGLSGKVYERLGDDEMTVADILAAYVEGCVVILTPAGKQAWEALIDLANARIEPGQKPYTVQEYIDLLGRDRWQKQAAKSKERG